MEQNQNTSLFGLTIDTSSRSHLFDAARWAKFLAIIGFIWCVLILIIGLYSGTILEVYNRRYEGFEREPSNPRGVGAVVAVFYSLLALLYFFPCLFLFQFAAKMKTALLANDQDTLNISFQNLKKTFRYVGVLTIIILSFAVLLLLMTLLAAAGTRG